MKLRTAILASLLAVLPTSVLADAVQSTTVTGNTAYTGAVTASDLNPLFGTQYIFGPTGSPTVPLSGLIYTNIVLQGLLINPGVPSTGYALTPIYGFSLQCIPYNPALLAVQGYPYNVDTSGFSGGTITIHEYKPTGAVVTIGTLVLPNSPQGGPYVSFIMSRLAQPYTPTAGSIIDAYITTLNVGPSQAWVGCALTAVLQPPASK